MISRKLPAFLLVFLTPTFLFSQINAEQQYPDCNLISDITYDEDELTPEKLRFRTFKTKDSLEAIYCLGKSTGNKELEAIGLYKMGLSFQNEHNNIESFKKMIRYIEESMSISRKEDYPYTLMPALEAMISNFTSNKVYSQAGLYADEFIGIAQKINDSVKISEGYMLKGRLLRDEGRFEESDSLLQLALTYQQNTAESMRVSGYTYLHLSNLKRLENKCDEATNYAKKGIEIANKCDNHKYFIISLLSLEIINCNLAQNKFDNEEYIENLKKFSDTGFSNWVYGQYQYVLGLTSLKKGDLATAIPQLKTSIENSYIAGTRLHTLEISEILLPLLIKNGATTEEILRVNQITSETIRDIEKHVGSDNLFQSTYYQLKSEEHENNYLESTIQNYYKLMFISTLMIILLISIGFLLYHKSKQTKAFNQQLNQLNFDLNRQNQQLEHSNVQIQKQHDELESEMKQNMMTLSSFRSLASKIKRMVQKNQELCPQFKRELFQTLEFEHSEDTIEDINIKFLELNQDFVNQLNSQYPALTNNDLKLCLYLKMNLSTKEIAQIQYKSQNTVKVARSRLRKKLEIEDPNVNLTSFLNTFEVAEVQAV